jgi:hypothetical protein
MKIPDTEDEIDVCELVRNNLKRGSEDLIHLVKEIFSSVIKQ